MLCSGEDDGGAGWHEWNLLWAHLAGWLAGPEEGCCLAAFYPRGCMLARPNHPRSWWVCRTLTALSPTEPPLTCVLSLLIHSLVSEEECAPGSRAELRLKQLKTATTTTDGYWFYSQPASHTQLLSLSLLFTLHSIRPFALPFKCDCVETQRHRPKKTLPYED